jgi:hypothetical protein
MKLNTNLVGMPVHALHFILHLEIVILAKSTIETMESFESNFTQVLKCLSCHLATKLCFTICCSLGFKYSMNSSNDVFLYTNVNFFRAFSFPELVSSRA